LSVVKPKAIPKEIGSPYSAMEFGNIVYDNLESELDEESSVENLAL
jgi:hypothetical protein